MTWFLDRVNDAREVLTDLLPDTGEQFSGAIRKTIIEGQRWGENDKARIRVTDEMIEKLGGIDVVSERYKRENPFSLTDKLKMGLPFGLGPGMFSKENRDPRTDPEWLLSAASDLMDKEPEVWGDLPRDMTSFDTTWKAQLERERAELADMTKRGDAPWTQFAGEMIGGFDDFDIATAPIGGAPRAGIWGFAKWMMSEGLIGAATEVPAVLKEQDQAKRLGFEAGNPLAQIGTSALFSTGLAGVLGGGGKALEYAFGRRTAEDDLVNGLGEDAISARAQADAAEEAMRRGDPPPPPALLKPDLKLDPADDPSVQNILTLISRIEAPKGFDQVSDYTVVAPPRPLTKMTVDEVLAWQSSNIGAGADSTAAGGYQIIRKTLAGLKDSLGLQGGELFDEALQRRMAVSLMKGRGLEDWRAGRISDTDFANSLAEEWAALPLTTGPRAGQSHYKGDGLNNAQVAVGETPDGNAIAPPEGEARAADDVIVSIETEGKTRDKPVSEEFLLDLRTAVAPLGNDVGVSIVSGGQDAAGTPGAKRTGSDRHDVDHTGHAHTADVVLTRNGKPVLPGEDPELYERFLYEAAKVYPGIGHYDWGVHVGGGSVASWGPDTTGKTLDPRFGAAIEAGRKGEKPRKGEVRVGGDTFLGVLGGERVSDELLSASGAGSAGSGGGTSRGASGSAGQSRQTFEELFGEISTPAGTRVQVKYEVIDASQLKAATGDLQPRDRSRAASDDQVTKIAARLDPARLMPGPESDRGAPVIGPDNIIESGNGRVLGISRARETNPTGFKGYVDAIRKAGFDVPEGMATPVLVARRTSALDFDGRVKFVRESNTSAIARMSATEQAKFDADYLSQHAFDAYKPGGKVNAPQNAEFIRRMFASIPPEERGALMAGGGGLNNDGYQRVRAALFARAFDADDLLKLSVETENRAVMNLIRMLEDVAPDWASFRAMVDAGMIRREFDITGPLMGAIRIIAKARIDGRDGQSVISAIRDRLAQGDMFAAPDPMVEAVIGIFYKGNRARNTEASAEILERYAAEAAQIGRADAPDMDGPVAPIDILGRAVEGEETNAPMPEMPARTETAAEPDIDVTDFDPAVFADGVDSEVIGRADDAMQDNLATTLSDAQLSELINRGASAEEIEAHPAVADAIMRAEAIEPTTNLPQYGTETFWTARKYVADDQELVGIDAAVDYLHDASRKLGWTEDGMQPPLKIAQDRKAVVLLGAPSAGKSSIANPLARNIKAAIIDGDEAKKLIPEFQDGLGAGAVHEESATIANLLLARAVHAGDNLIIPKVGGSPGGIKAVIDHLRAAGYTIDVHLVDVTPDEAWRRMIGRFQKTGRLIPPKVMKDGIDGAPKTYELLKAEGYADGFAKIDNTPGLGQPRGILEDASTISPAFLSRNGGDGNEGPGLGVPASSAQVGRGDGSGQARVSDEALPAQTEITLGEGGDAITRSLADIDADLKAEQALDEAMQFCAFGGKS